MTDESFWSTAVANMDRCAHRRASRHPEAVTYVDGLTARLDQLDDDGVTKVRLTIRPAYFFDHWGRENEFEAARRFLRRYADPSRGEGPPFDVREKLSAVAAPTLVLVGIPVSASG
ncbi:hypothetical protein [Streptomyces sp. AK02-01A]|uniref:hypothetical protein n=1 Tax=Streptomyces sp. AK02-01A TaxID=3028648 RepID=UPI0029BEA878|nr:hypothetical protein [Streptomyces sp. AK02-01A]MDX3852699.1 hypothetical protein [Streptomyces sp. AK02-01A]